jgi:hypothetical protein
MEFLIFTMLLVMIFCFMVYLPTSLLVKKFDNKDEYESLLLFIAVSLIFTLLTYLYANFYLLKSTMLTSPVACDYLANMNCLFNKDLARELGPTIDTYCMIFMQLLVSFAYTYFVAVNINDYKAKERRVINLIVFFIVSVAASLISITVMGDVAFVSGIKYISLFISNAYIVLPLFYMLILAFKYSKRIKDK